MMSPSSTGSSDRSGQPAKRTRPVPVDAPARLVLPHHRPGPRISSQRPADDLHPRNGVQPQGRRSRFLDPPLRADRPREIGVVAGRQPPCRLRHRPRRPAQIGSTSRAATDRPAATWFSITGTIVCPRSARRTVRPQQQLLLPAVRRMIRPDHIDRPVVDRFQAPRNAAGPGSSVPSRRSLQRLIDLRGDLGQVVHQHLAGGEVAEIFR